MNIYIDESIHSDFGFMILAYVLCKDDPQEELERVIATYKKNEYHSSERMQDNAKSMGSDSIDFKKC